jgi:hypothetical protein
MSRQERDERELVYFSQLLSELRAAQMAHWKTERILGSGLL